MIFLEKSPSLVVQTLPSAPHDCGLFLRFILSLASCKRCLAIDDQLNILPISSHAASVEALPPQTPVSCREPGTWGRLRFLCWPSRGGGKASPPLLSGRRRVLGLLVWS